MKNTQSLILNKLPIESSMIAELVKEYIHIADDTALAILFGSRARGDASVDSDWDFLVLTQHTDTDRLANELRKIILREVELKYEVAISLIVKNKTLWESDYAVTNIYKSIAEEGVAL